MVRPRNRKVRWSKLLVALVALLAFSLLVLRNNPQSQTQPHPATSHTIKSLPPPSPFTLCQRRNYPRPWELRSDQLTVLISGFSESRLPLLQNIVRAYSGFTCVHSIVVLWGNDTTPSKVIESLEFESRGSPIYILRQPSRSLNDRFLPRDFVVTRSVLVCDDDIEIDEAALCFALRVWGQHGGRRLVGFFARAHAFEMESGAWIYTVDPDRYSIVLTKLMIVGTEFLYRYTCAAPAGVKEVVERAKNCEDIAMNFLVADRSGAGPLVVEGSPRDWGDPRNSEGGSVVDAALSGLEDHRKRRGICITEFHRLWGRMPLRYSYGIVAPRVREQGLCRKSGALLPCDQAAGLNRGRH